ncbi:MAG: hypothetical protein L0216_06640 [Planctomycetales bacterium]|nr:hypothetical protein [Planctomycetales bacterium]
MGKGCAVLVVGVLAVGGAAAFVVLSDAGPAREARSWLEKQGVKVPRPGAPSAATPPAEKAPKAETSKPKAPAPAGTAVAAPSAPERGKSWGPLEASSGPKRPSATAAELAKALEVAALLLRRLDLEAAAAELAKASTADGPADVRERAAALLDRLGLLKRLVADVPRNELASHEGVVTVSLASGGTREGRIVAEDSGSVTIQGDYGIKAKFKRDDIRSIEKVTPAQRQARFDAEVMARKRTLEKPTGLDLYRLAAYCLENGLLGRAGTLLEEAFRLDADLVKTVTEFRARSLYKVYLWLRSRGDKRAGGYAEKLLAQYPDTTWAAEVRTDEEVARGARRPVLEPDPEPESPAAPPVVEAPEPGPAPGKAPVPPRAGKAPAGSPASALLEQAEKALARAHAHEEAAEPEKPNADAENGKAIAAFKEAIDLFQRALKAGARNKAAIDESLEDAQASLYWCKKRQKLG